MHTAPTPNWTHILRVVSVSATAAAAQFSLQISKQPHEYRSAESEKSFFNSTKIDNFSVYFELASKEGGGVFFGQLGKSRHVKLALKDDLGQRSMLYGEIVNLSSKICHKTEPNRQQQRTHSKKK